MKGSGKTHLTKLFVLEALCEVQNNPHAKLVIYEPKREFYAWLCSLKAYGLRARIDYFLPSDRRSVALDFGADYRGLQDSLTLAYAFNPYNPQETQQFWSDALRSIYAAVYYAIHRKLGRADLRLVCLVLEDEENVRCLLKDEPDCVSAYKLLVDRTGQPTETERNIHMTIHSRLAAMRILAAHLDQARRHKALLSLRKFVERPGPADKEGRPRGRVLVVSKDSRFKSTQDPMNGVLFLRLVEILDGQQQDPDRKVFLVIDEFPTLAGDNPCPGIIDAFLRLRSRGVTILMTYQAITSLKRIYGPEASETLGQCTNVIYLRQADLESAEYASTDLGHDWGKEEKISRTQGDDNLSRTQQSDWFDRAKHPPTELLNYLPPASREIGIRGRAKSPAWDKDPYKVRIDPLYITRRIPQTDHESFPEYLCRSRNSERLRALTAGERKALGLPPARPMLQEGQTCPPDELFLDG